MKKRFLLMLGLILCIAVLAGCGQQKEEETETAIENDAQVVGTWVEDYFDSGYTFNADGTGVDLFWDLPFTYTAYDGVITIKYADETYGEDKYGYQLSEGAINLTRRTGEGGSYTYNKK